MIKNPEILEWAELAYEREHLLTIEQKLAMFEEMYQFVAALGRMNARYTENDLEEIISLARKLHGNIPATSRAHR